MHFQPRQRLVASTGGQLDYSSSADRFLACRLQQGGLVFSPLGQAQSFPLSAAAGPASVHPDSRRLAFFQDGCLCLCDLGGKLLAARRLGPLHPEALAFDASGRLAMLSRHEDYTLLSWLDDRLISQARRAFPPLDQERAELHLVPNSSLAVVLLARGQQGGKLVVCRIQGDDLAVLASRECPSPIHGLSLAPDGRHLLLGQPDAVELFSLPDLSLTSRLCLPGWMGFGGGFVDENRALWPGDSGQVGYLIARVGDELFSDGSLFFEDALLDLRVSANGWLLTRQKEWLGLGKVQDEPASTPALEPVAAAPLELDLKSISELLEDRPDEPEWDSTRLEDAQANLLREAASLGERGRLAEAIALLPNPSTAAAWELRARLEILAGRTADALESLNQYLRLTPRDLEARLTAARLSRRSEDFLALLDQLLSQGRPDWLLVSQAAWFGFSQLEKARAAAEQALQAEPYSARAWVWKGRLELEADQPEAARDSLKRGLELVPNLAEGWYWLGQACTRLNRAEAAAEAYQKGRQLLPLNRRLAEACGQQAEEHDDWTL